jgi:hypothetical protein
VGRLYVVAACKFDSISFLADSGSNLLQKVEAPGIECGQYAPISTDLDPYESADREIGGKRDEKEASVAQALAQISAVSPPGDAAPSVEDALALALGEASKAQRWDVVAMLAKELEARRLAGSNVVNLADVKRGLPRP